MKSLNPDCQTQFIKYIPPPLALLKQSLREYGWSEPVFTPRSCARLAVKGEEEEEEKKNQSEGRGVTHCCWASREKEGPGALSRSCRAAKVCLHLQWYMRGGVGGWSWEEGRQEKGSERFGEITALNMLRPLRSFPIHSCSFPFLDRETITFHTVTSKRRNRPNMTPNIAIAWPLSEDRSKSPALKTLMKICLLSHSKWHLTMMVIFQIVAKTFLQAMTFFPPLLGQAQVTSAESFPWTQGYELKTRRRWKRGLTFWAIVFGFTQAAKAKCFAIIIQGGLSLFFFFSNHDEDSKQKRSSFLTTAKPLTETRERLRTVNRSTDRVPLPVKPHQ